MPDKNHTYMTLDELDAILKANPMHPVIISLVQEVRAHLELEQSTFFAYMQHLRDIERGKSLRNGAGLPITNKAA